jgi:hypothetical protein
MADWRIKHSTQDVFVWPGDREAPSDWIVRSLLRPAFLAADVPRFSGRRM